MKIRNGLITVAAFVMLVISPQTVRAGDPISIISGVLGIFQTLQQMDPNMGRQQRRQVIEGQVKKIYVNRGPSPKQLADMIEIGIDKARRDGKFVFSDEVVAELAKVIGDEVRKEVRREVAEEFKRQQQLAEAEKSKQALQILPPRASAKKGPETSEAPVSPKVDPAPKADATPPAKKEDSLYQQAVIRKDDPVMRPQPLQMPAPVGREGGPSAAQAESEYVPAVPHSLWSK